MPARPDMTTDQTAIDIAKHDTSPLDVPLWRRLPKARFRIYSSVSQYVRLLGAIVTGKVRPGPANTELESKLKSYFGRPHAVVVNQARVGLYLAFKAILTPERPKVVMSPYTIYDVVNMVIA